MDCSSSHPILVSALPAWRPFSNSDSAGLRFSLALQACGMHLPVWGSCRQSLPSRCKAGRRSSCVGYGHGLSGAAGGMAGGFFATSIGDKHPFGIEGWRFAFFLIASVSVFTGILTAVMASDPRMVGFC